MNEFYIDVKLSQGLTRIQVDEVSPEQWDVPYAPQFIIEFHNGREFITLTLHLEDGKWYDRNQLLSGEDKQLLSFEPDADECNLNYNSPLTVSGIQLIGEAIGRHMIVHLTAYMALFVPVFRNPDLN